MRRVVAGLVLVSASAATRAQTPTDPWAALAFLDGTWSAQAQGDRGAAVVGHYTFRRELDGHVLARHSANGTCKVPADFDCDHGDLLYVFQDAPGQSLKAIYLDNEGHVIHYAVSTPSPDHVLFLSEPGPGPRFRLTYERTGATMSGRFEMQVPGQEAWTSYLAWSGARIAPPPRTRP